MGWPQPTDYNEAVQNPRVCFNDPDLQTGEVVTDALGVPRPHSGNFADVYQIRGPNGKAWAVKCFTREVSALQARYQSISEHLRRGSLPFMVQFQYLTNGIRTGGKWYPILKMDWVEGYTLNEFVRKYVNNPQVMYRLAKMWVKLSMQLRRANMAHADLQHGNVMLVPGEKSSQLSLRLIDYDGMYVPDLEKTPSGEVGHPNYQHPLRLKEGIYNSEVDRFPHLVIYTALRCLTVGGRELWERHNNGENLLFREKDFSASTESKLLLDLWQLPDLDIRRLLGHLLISSQMPLERVIMLDEMVGSEGRPLGLTGGQERHVQDLLPPGAARMKVPPAIVSQHSLEELVAEMDDKPLDHPSSILDNGAAAKAPANTNNVGPPAPARQTVPSHVHDRHKTAPPLLLAAFRWRCLHCWEAKHALDALCPHCHKTDWVIFTITAIIGIVGMVLASIGLTDHEPGLLIVIGTVGGFMAVAALPVATGLLVRSLLGPERKPGDFSPGVRWPALDEVCPRCGKVNTMPLFCCRLCGRLSSARLAMVCAFALITAVIMAICQYDADAPPWWQMLSLVVDWIPRLFALAAVSVVFIGVFDILRLQPRLPKEGRIYQSRQYQGALVAATLAAFLCLALLSFGLISRA